jgi:hypothetical protein
MTQLISRIVTASALVLGGAFSGETSAQVSKDQLVGSWSLVSLTLNQDGKKREPFGSNPTGLMIFDANGRFAQVITRPDVAKFASGNRETGTPEENKAAVQGSIANFGTYTVSEGTLSLRIEGSSFPNWRGADQKRTIAISGDELKWTNPTPSAGAGTAELVRKRLK